MFHIMPPRRANYMNVKASNENAAPLVAHQHVSNAELRNDIQMFAQSVSNQNNRVQDPLNANVDYQQQGSMNLLV